MCGRYYIESEDSTLELLAIIDEVNRKSKAGPVKTGEIFPTDVQRLDPVRPPPAEQREGCLIQLLLELFCRLFSLMICAASPSRESSFTSIGFTCFQAACPGGRMYTSGNYPITGFVCANTARLRDYG